MPSLAPLGIVFALSTLLFGCGEPPPRIPRLPCPNTPCETALDGLDEDALYVIAIGGGDVADANGCFRCGLDRQEIAFFQWPAELTLEAAVTAAPRTPQMIEGSQQLSPDADAGHVFVAPDPRR